MRILIAEDDYASRKFLSQFLSDYGDVDVTIDGAEAVMAFQMALDGEEYYDLVCLDIMMPHKDGQEVLAEIRQMEADRQLAEKNCAKAAAIFARFSLNVLIYSFASWQSG